VYRGTRRRDGHHTAAVTTAVATTIAGTTAATVDTIFAPPSPRTLAGLRDFALPPPTLYRPTTVMDALPQPHRYASATPSPASTPDLTSGKNAAADGSPSAEEAVAAVVAARSVAITNALRLRRGGAYGPRAYVGSVPGRRANRARDFEGGMRRIMADYFGLDGNEPVHDEATFERLFRVPRIVFERIFEGIKEELFWRQTVNAMGRPQAYALQKLVAVFRVLAFGEAYDRADEYVRLSKATIEICVKKLLDFLITRYEPECLR